MTGSKPTVPTGEVELTDHTIDAVAESDSSETQVKAQGHARTVAAATIGTALENVDITLYAFLAVSLSRAFFPADDPTIALLITFLTYGITFLIRPLGAIIFGSYADKVGRTKALSAILALMGVGSLMIGVMPTYAMIGIWAPIGIFAARILQGISVGGEQGSAIALIAERDKKRTTEFLGYLLSAAGIGQIISAGIGAALAYSLTSEQLHEWGWRIAFLFGALIYPVGMYIRRHTNESKEFVTATKEDRPVMIIIRKYPIELVCSMFLSSAVTVMIYLVIYLPTYAVSRLGMDLETSLMMTVASGGAMAIMAPLGGMVADRLGRVRFVVIGSVLMILLPWFSLSWLAANPDATHLFLVQLVIGFILAVYGPAQLSILANIYPVAVRASGASLSTALAGSSIGGFSLFGFAAIGFLVDHPAAPSIYAIGSAAFALASILILWRRHGAALELST